MFIDIVSEGIEMKGELTMIATANEISQAVMQEANKQIENIPKGFFVNFPNVFVALW